jgi:YfiH family protein
MLPLVWINGRRYACFAGLGQLAGLRHAFSTRPLNVAPRDGVDVQQRAANRAAMTHDLGFDPERLCFCQQVHQTNLAVVDGTPCGGPLGEVDGVLTATPGTALMTFSADCPLVLLYDPLRRVIGLAHASWRCTVGEISRRLVELAAARFGCRPADLRAGIGPGAGPCCYEVRDDVYEAAAGLTQRERLFLRRDGRLFFDLWTANKLQLLAAGLDPNHIESADVCTLCRNDLFYSYRREGAGCGHFGLLAGLTDT